MSPIDEYLANVTPPQRKALEHIREIIKQIVPEAEEAISYEMPTFKYKRKNLIHFAAFKNHLSIFPTPGPMSQMDESLKPYRTGKGTLQFTEDAPIPDALIKELVLIRKQTIDG